MTRRSVLAVAVWMAGALLSFSATAVGVRALSRTLGVFEILACRSAAGILIILTVALLQPSARREIRSRRWPLHLIRNVVHFGATYAWALGVTLLPLGIVFALEFTAPVWVALLAALFLGERMTSSRAVAILGGILGVLIILRPGLEALQAISLVVLASALGFAVTSIATKKLTATESTMSILLWMNVIQLPLNLAGGDLGFWTKLDASHVVPLAAVCVGGLAAHFCLTNAYRHGDATVVVPLDFLRIPLIALIGWGLYAEPLDPFVFLGSGVIVAGILYSLRAEARRG
jgi:drug/metabolite transporter (DMT)-like permease